MKIPSIQAHYDVLLKIYADFSLREFRYKEGNTEDIREEAKRLCTIYKDQCANYIEEHRELQHYFFGQEGDSLGFEKETFFDWSRFSSNMGRALTRMQESLEQS